MKKRAKVLLGAVTLLLMLFMTACAPASNVKTYTLTIGVDDTALYTVNGGVFTEGHGPTATTTVTLEIDGENYKLTKTCDTTEEGKAFMKNSATLGKEEPIHFEFVFEGTITQKEDGSYLLSEAARGTGQLDWGGFATVGLYQSMALTTSEQDASILNWFSSPYVVESFNEAQVVTLNSDGTFEYVVEDQY